MLNNLMFKNQEGGGGIRAELTGQDTIMTAKHRISNAPGSEKLSKKQKANIGNIQENVKSAVMKQFYDDDYMRKEWINATQNRDVSRQEFGDSIKISSIEPSKDGKTISVYLDDGGKDFYGGHGWHVELDGNTFKVLRTDLVG